MILINLKILLKSWFMRLEARQLNSAFYIRNRAALISIERDFVWLDEDSVCDWFNQY